MRNGKPWYMAIGAMLAAGYSFIAGSVRAKHAGRLLRLAPTVCAIILAAPLAPRVPLAASPLPAVPDSSIVLGGINLDGYCRSIGYLGTVLSGSDVYSLGCVTPTGGRAGLDIQAACRWGYNRDNATAQYRNFNDPNSWQCYAPATGFVQRSGRALTLNGSPYRFIGVNISPVSASYPLGCGRFYPNTADVDAIFSHMHSMGVTVDRVWITQYYTASGTNFDRTDYVLQKAAQYGIKIIFTLENEWSDCSGYEKYGDYYTTGYLSPQGSELLSYKDYITAVIARYRNNAAVMAWELMNEPHARGGPSSDSGAYNTCNTAPFLSWVSAIVPYVHSLDPNHLVTLGAVDDLCFVGADYQNLMATDGLDIVADDDYRHATDPLPNSSPRSVATGLQTATSLNKPYVIVEAGIYSNCAEAGCVPQTTRAANFSAKFDAFFASGGAGFTVWAFEYNATPTKNAFDINDPLVPVIRAKAATL